MGTWHGLLTLACTAKLKDEIEALRRLSDKMSLNPVSQSPGWS